MSDACPVASDVALSERLPQAVETTATTEVEMSMEVAVNQSPDSPAVERRKSHGRSRVSNGRDVLPDCDGRSTVARRFRDITSQILVDMGGADLCSESRKQLVRRFAAAAVLAEQMEAALARGEEIDVQEHALLCSTLTRLASRIGIERRAKPVQTLSEYLTQLAEEEAAAAAGTATESMIDAGPVRRRSRER